MFGGKSPAGLYTQAGGGRKVWKKMWRPWQRMGWFVTALVIAILVAFNIYVADGLIRMQRDLKQIQKLLLDGKKNV